MHAKYKLRQCRAVQLVHDTLLRCTEVRRDFHKTWNFT